MDIKHKQWPPINILRRRIIQMIALHNIIITLNWIQINSFEENLQTNELNSIVSIMAADTIRIGSYTNWRLVTAA